MKKTLFAILLVVFVTESMAQRYVTLYSECNYSGRASKLSPGRYELSSQNVGAFTLSSMRVPYGLKIIIYTGGTPGTGEKTNFVHDVSCLNYDWNDKAGAVVVEELDENSNKNYNYSSNRAPQQPNYHDLVTVYENCNMTGRRVSLGAGSYRPDSFSEVGDDNISSIYIPKGWKVIAYLDKHFDGASQTYTNTVNCLQGNFNNGITALKVIPPSGNNYQESSSNYNQNNQQYNTYHANNASGIDAYADMWYGGSHKKFTPGAYDLNGTNLDGKLSSINVDYGYEVVLFENYNFGGQSYTVHSSQLNLSSIHWNDRVRSLIVRKQN